MNDGKPPRPTARITDTDTDTAATFLRPFFTPQSVAVVGASRNMRKGGNVIIRNLQRFGYPGMIYPINPHAETILGLKAYPSLEVLSELDIPELVMIVVPRERVLPVLEECVTVGVRAVIISTAGFSDSGAEGKALEEELVAVAEQGTIRLLGPNSIGTVDPESAFTTSITTLAVPSPGGCAFVGQTGMFASGFIQWLTTREHLGCGKIACLGNKADIDETDFITYLANDPETRVVSLYLESVRKPQAFMNASLTCSKRKPLIVLKSGQTEVGAAMAASHTGALAGDDRVFHGALRQVGALRVEGFEELFDLAKGFELLPIPEGPGVAVVSITGVGCVLTADACAKEGLSLPRLHSDTQQKLNAVYPEWFNFRNPIDLWAAIERSGPEAAYATALHAVIEDENVETILAIFTLIDESDFEPRELFRELRERFPAKAIIACILGGEVKLYGKWQQQLESAERGAGVPVYSSVDRAVRVIASMYRYGRWREEQSK